MIFCQRNEGISRTDVITERNYFYINVRKAHYSSRFDHFNSSISHRKRLTPDHYHCNDYEHKKSKYNELHKSKFNYYEARNRFEPKQMKYSDYGNDRNGVINSYRTNFVDEYNQSSTLTNTYGYFNSNNVEFDHEFDKPLIVKYGGKVNDQWRSLEQPNFLNYGYINKEKIEEKMTLIKDNSRSNKRRINSLLGDGPEQCRLNSVSFTKEYSKSKTHFKELDNEHNVVNSETKSCAFIDYKHGNLSNNNYQLVHKEISNIRTVDNKHIELQSCVSDRILNENKWTLIRLEAPLRISISADNIDLRNCSIRDPRVEHLLKSCILT